MRRSLIISVSAVAALLLGVTACSGTASSGSHSVEVSADTIVIDVRTPEEYSAGHLEGAQLIDFNDGEVTEVIPHLDRDAEYFVYCRSGNRSGQAIALMEQAGFPNLTNLGSLQQAADATGLSVVVGI